MIENLKGIYETVHFKENTSFRLYENDTFENYPPHWHNSMEIIMPLENIYTVDCHNQKTVLREGDLIFIWPGCIHTLYAPEKGKRIIFIIDITIISQIKQMSALQSLLAPVTLVTPEKYPDSHTAIRTSLLEICEEYHKDILFSDLFIYGRMLHIFSELSKNATVPCTCFDVTTTKQQEYTDKFIYICSYITEHCTENLSLDMIANLAGFSKFHFSRLFKQFTNISFYRFLNEKRISIAENLLINLDNTVTDVALQSGFSNISSFIRMFKQIKNCTPSEFRSMYYKH